MPKRTQGSAITRATCRCCWREYSVYVAAVQDGRDRQFCPDCTLAGCKVDKPLCDDTQNEATERTLMP